MKILECSIYHDFEFDENIVFPKNVIDSLKELNQEVKNIYPGMWLEEVFVDKDIILDIPSNIDKEYLLYKLAQSCRKLCMMYYASEKALKTERDFYSTTLKESPCLFGREAIELGFYLEAYVLLARASLEIASNVFGYLLPEPFNKKRYDSFNYLIKEIVKHEENLEISKYFIELREDKKSWLSIISDTEKGRSLRDKLAHQTEFPIIYTELYPWTEKEFPVVLIDKNDFIELDDFVKKLREGVVEGFRILEQYCYKNIKKI